MTINDVAAYYMQHPMTERSLAEQLFLALMNGANGCKEHKTLARNVKRPVPDKSLDVVDKELHELLTEAGEHIGFTFENVSVYVTVPTEANNYYSYKAVVSNMKNK
jgi:hypothetical protein